MPARIAVCLMRPVRPRASPCVPMRPPMRGSRAPDVSVACPGTLPHKRCEPRSAGDTREMKAIRIHAHGPPDVMRWEDVELPAPAAGEARLRHTAIAVNFSDINQRRGGFYTAEPAPMPMIPGNEAAGVVESVGPGVTE